MVVALQSLVCSLWVVCGQHVDAEVIESLVELLVLRVKFFWSSEIDPNGDDLAVKVHLLDYFWRERAYLHMATRSLRGAHLLNRRWRVVKVKVLQIDSLNLIFWLALSVNIFESS